jgi:hypothetical protein
MQKIRALVIKKHACRRRRAALLGEEGRSDARARVLLVAVTVLARGRRPPLCDAQLQPLQKALTAFAANDVVAVAPDVAEGDAGPSMTHKKRCWRRRQRCRLLWWPLLLLLGARRRR